MLSFKILNHGYYTLSHRKKYQIQWRNGRKIIFVPCSSLKVAGFWTFSLNIYIIAYLVSSLAVFPVPPFGGELKKIIYIKFSVQRL